MTAGPEAVTRALHALYHRKKADRECQYANPERCRIYAEASRDASVLASLPDDRLAEAEKDANGPGWFWTRTEWSEWSNELALLIPEEYDDDVAQEAIISRAVADMVKRLAEAEAKLRRVEAICDLIRANDGGIPIDIEKRLREALDADPDTPTACETCGDAGWFTADPSDPEFCECAAGKRLMAANNADPDTPTADAPADTDLVEQIARVLVPVLDQFFAQPEFVARLARSLLPLVRAQVEAARRDAWDECCQAFGWCLNNGPTDSALEYAVAHNPYRDRAARGETRQP